MWIRTQNKQRIVNSDQIIDIFIARTQPVIYANTTDDADNITLGEYKDKETCLALLEALSLVAGLNIPMMPMPLGGEVEDWLKDTVELANYYISKDFNSLGNSQALHFFN